jgi:hypothetical protein
MVKDNQKLSKFEIFKNGFIGGIGTAFGATVGFAIVSSIIIFILSHLGGLPLIGGWLANIVKVTQNALR